MKVFGHDYVSVNDEPVLAARFFEDGAEAVSAFRGAQDGLTMVTATGDEVQMLCAVVAMELSRHGARLEGMRSLDCDRARRRFVTKAHTSRSEGRVRARRRALGWIANFSRLLAVQCDSISTTPCSPVW